MARVKGGYLGGIYDIPKKQPLDSRMLVTKKVDLINPSTWKTGGSPTGEFGHYNGMIVAVNSDGIYNGVYYLTNRNAITEDNYAAYKVALAAGEDVSSYFAMWTKLGTLDELDDIQSKIGEVPEGKTLVDLIADAAGACNLVPVDGTIVIGDGGKTIGVAVAPIENNALVAVEGGLFVPTVVVPEYSIEKQTIAEEGYVASYKLKKVVGDVVTYVGDTINIAKDMVIQSASLETVVETNVPYDGAVIGDPYIKMVFNDVNASNIYIPVKGLVDIYTAGVGIEIVNNKIEVKLADVTHGLVAVEGALTLNLVTHESDGAMSKEDKIALDTVVEDVENLKEAVSGLQDGSRWGQC